VGASDPSEAGPNAATPGPVIVDAVVDPLEPPMPPKITPDEAAKLAESLARGEPNREQIALNIAREKVRELI
jgi:pyruvate dehydrogenase (quinone)/pyruvate oxidase